MNSLLTFLTGLAAVFSVRTLPHARQWKRSTHVSNDDNAVAVSNVTGPNGSAFALNDKGNIEMRFPFGRYPGVNDKGQRVIQVLDQNAVDLMAGVFSNNDGIISKVRSFVRGGWHRRSDVPLYKGHPDDRNSGDTDESAQGWLKDIRADAVSNELVLEYEPTPDGLALIEKKAFRFASPRWDTRPVSNGAKDEVMPWMMLSTGLTNRNNIPMKPLSNEDAGAHEEEQEHTEQVSNCCLCNASEQLKRSVCQKLFLEPDATAEQINAALDLRAVEIQRMTADLNALKQQLADEQAAKLKLETAGIAANSLIEEQRATISNLTAERDSATSNRAATWNAFVQLSLKGVQAEGKLLPADFESEVTAGCAMSNTDFEAHLTKLHARSALMKTTRITGNAADQREAFAVSNSDEGHKARQKQRSDFISAFMNSSAMQGTPTEQRRAAAWWALKQQHPELIDG